MALTCTPIFARNRSGFESPRLHMPLLLSNLSRSSMVHASRRATCSPFGDCRPITASRGLAVQRSKRAKEAVLLTCQRAELR